MHVYIDSTIKHAESVSMIVHTVFPISLFATLFRDKYSPHDIIVCAIYPMDTCKGILSWAHCLAGILFRHKFPGCYSGKLSNNKKTP